MDFASVMVFLLVPIIVGTNANALRPKAAPTYGNCVTEGCVTVSGFILQNLDKTTDPCRDFYRYACGRFIDNSWIVDQDESDDSNDEVTTKKKGANSEVLDIHDSFRQRIENIIDQTFKTPANREADRKASIFYSKCVQQKTVSKEKNLEFLRQILRNVGGFYVTLEHRNVGNVCNNWSVEETMAKVTPYLINLGLLQLHISRDDYNASRYAITLAPAALTPLTADSPFSGQSKVRRPKSSKGPTKNPAVEAYMDFFYQLSTSIFPGEHVDNESLTDLIGFEGELTRLIADSELNATSKTNRPLKLDADSLYRTCSSMDWLRLANRLGHLYNVTILKLTERQRFDPTMRSFFDNLSIYTTSQSYIVGLCQLLRKTMQLKNGPTVIQNYLALAAAMPFVGEIGDASFRQFRANLGAVDDNSDNRQHCRKLAQDMFDLVVSRRYVERFFSDQSKAIGQQMAEDIRQELVGLFGNSGPDFETWMEQKTRENARLKAQKMLLEIGHPEKLLDDSWLESQYKDIEIKGNMDHLENLLAITRSAIRRQLRRLDQIPNRKEWSMHAYENNAEYDVTANAIHVTAAEANEPFFRPDFPLAWNYGSLGYTIGHELTHSIDTTGSMYDSDGQLAADGWWGDASKREFARRSECLVEQIANVTLPFLPSQITDLINKSKEIGQKTLDENIADNGGIKLAYNAFRKRIGSELKNVALPGLSLTNEQIFFLSIAQSYCTAASNSYIQALLEQDEHSLNVIRIRSMMMNLAAWSAAFNCPGSSPMNPVNKCQVW